MWACASFRPRGFVDERLDNGVLFKIHTRPFRLNRFLYVFFYMISPFLLLGCNLSYIVDLVAALHELASANDSFVLHCASLPRTIFASSALARAKRKRFLSRTFALIVSAHPYCARKSTCRAMPRHASSARAKY